MKRLMFAMVAALSFAALAQEAGAPKAEAQRLDPRARAAMQSRSMMPRGDMMGDPAVTAATNPKVAEKIGLSQEVREQIKKLDQDNRAKVKDIQTKTRVAMEKQATLMKAEKIDEAAVMASIDEVFECRKEMAKSQIKRVIAVKSLLTPDQLAKAVEEMKALREERRGKRGQKLGARPEGNPGAKPEGAPGEQPGDKPEGNPPPPPPAQ